MEEGVPLPDTEVVASRESMGAGLGARSLGVPKVSSIAWIFGLYPLSLPLLCLAPGTLAPLLRVRSISSVTLELFDEKGTGGTGLTNTPSQILERHPHGFVETVRVPSLDYGLQLLTHVETVFRQLHGILVVNHLVLVESSMRVHGWMQNGAPTRIRARVVLVVLNICFAEETSTASLFKISILSSRSDALALRVRVAIFAGLV